MASAPSRKNFTPLRRGGLQQPSAQTGSSSDQQQQRSRTGSHKDSQGMEDAKDRIQGKEEVKGGQDNKDKSPPDHLSQSEDVTKSADGSKGEKKDQEKAQAMEPRINRNPDSSNKDGPHRDRRRDGTAQNNSRRGDRGSSSRSSKGRDSTAALAGGRYEPSSSGRGSGNRGRGYPTGGLGSGQRGRSREYRRTKPSERGPRFDKNKEKVSSDKGYSGGKPKKKDPEESSCSDGEVGPSGGKKVPSRLRQKDEDSDLSVEEVSASTTDSVSFEKSSSVGPTLPPVVGQEAAGNLRSSGNRNDKVRANDTQKKQNFQQDSRKMESKDESSFFIESGKGLCNKDGAFAPRGEPSRRGRGGASVSFRSSRGPTIRYTSSNYGPPPSKAAFGGSNRMNKTEENKLEEHGTASKEHGTGDNKESNSLPPGSSNVNTTLTAMTGNATTVSPVTGMLGAPSGTEMSHNDYHKNKTNSKPIPGGGSGGEKFSRKPDRFSSLPPRFQKRQARRFDGNNTPGMMSEQGYRGSGRGGGRSGGGNRSGRSGRGSGHPGASNNLHSSAAKENLSDVANEEWETASESSDIGERRSGNQPRDDSSKKGEGKDWNNQVAKKSFSGQRPDGGGGGCGGQGRNRSHLDHSRGPGGHHNNFDLGGGKSRSSRGGRGGLGHEKKMDNQNAFSGGQQNRSGNGTGYPQGSAHSNSGRPVGNSGRNTGGGNRSGPGGSGPLNQRNENATIYRVEEIKYNQSNIQAAISDLAIRYKDS